MGECVYYYYDCGYSCQVKREKEGNSSIDSDTVYKYCWSYSYEDCPRYKSKNSSSGGCFLTSACIEAKGLPDDCIELTILRNFRDNYMKSAENGQDDINEYYNIAPAIVERIHQQDNALEIFECIYSELVIPCVRLIQNGQNADAHMAYRNYVRKLQAEY